VAVSPETMRFGSSRVRAEEAGGPCWAESARGKITDNAHNSTNEYDEHRESMVRL
jgi:hypothetical protein